MTRASHTSGDARLDSGEEHGGRPRDRCFRPTLPLPRWLVDIGAAPVVEEQEDSGFVYYGRHFRSADGQMPVMLGPLKQDVGTIGVLTLPADNGTWSVTLTRQLEGCRSPRAASPRDLGGVNRLLPLTAHWIDVEQLEDGVTVMAKIEDRIRDFAPGGNPVATGVVAVADSWSCTNPSLGRGATIGLLHALALRDQLRAAGGPLVLRAPGGPGRPSAILEPWYRARGLRQSSAAGDSGPDRRASLRERRRVLAPQSRPGGGGPSGRRQLRAVLDMGMALRRPDEVLADASLRERIMGHGWTRRHRTRNGARSRATARPRSAVEEECGKHARRQFGRQPECGDHRA